MAVLENDVPAARTATGRSPAAFALLAAGVLFVLYPALRPYGDVTPEGSAAAFASPLWLVAHLAAVAGFVLLGAGCVLLAMELRRAQLRTATR